MQIVQFLLKPTSSQIKIFNKMLLQHGEIYNHCLSFKKQTYKQNKTNLSTFDLIMSEIPKFKEAGKINLCNHSSCQQTIRRLGKSFDRFYKKISRYPKLKPVYKFSTIEFGKLGDGWGFKNNLLRIQHVGNLKFFHIEHPFTKPYRLVLTRKNGQFYANIYYKDGNRLQKYTKKKRVVGLDFGLTNFITTSDGMIVSRPQFYKNKSKQISRISSQINKIEKQSNKRYRKRKALNKIYRKISNQQKDFNHKLSRYLINNYKNIFLEKLSIQQLKSILNVKQVNKAYNNSCWNQFINYLKYKAESAGSKVIFVKSNYTSQICSNCNKQNQISIKEKFLNCSNCKMNIHRDLNAAFNILRRGLASLNLKNSKSLCNKRISHPSTESFDYSECVSKSALPSLYNK